MSAKAKAIFHVHVKDMGFEKLMEMAHRIHDEKPYAKAGIIGTRAAKKRMTELEEANHQAARESAKLGGQKAPKRPQGSGISNVELAVIHEFGAPSAGIPERSFIRSSIEKNRSKYEAMQRELCRQILELKTDERKALGILGLSMSTDMKLGITHGSGIQPPNAPSTMARKAAKTRRPRGLVGPLPSPRALVDTGQLVGSISWAVVLKDEETAAPAEGGA